MNMSAKTYRISGAMIVYRAIIISIRLILRLIFEITLSMLRFRTLSTRSKVGGEPSGRKKKVFFYK